MTARTLPRDMAAWLHRINRNRRAVYIVAESLRLTFRCLPPILWDRWRWAQDFADRARRAAGVAEEEVLRRIFGESDDGNLPWRITDVLGVTERRMTAQGRVWHAENKAFYWWAKAKVTADQTGAELSLEVRRVY